MLYGKILQSCDIIWVYAFLLGAICFCARTRFSWIKPRQLLAFFLLRFTLGIGMSLWAIISDQEFDSAGYYVVGQEFAQRFRDLITGKSIEYLQVTPFFGFEGLSTDRFASFTGLLLACTGNSFLAATLIVSCIGAVGQLLFYKFIRLRFPMIPNRYLFLLLFHPSLMLWSGLLMKDAIGIFAIGMLAYNVDRMFSTKRIRHMIGVAIGIDVAYNYRSFILVLFMIFILFSYYNYKFEAFTSQWRKAQKLLSVLYIYLSVVAVALVTVYYLKNYGRDLVDLQKEGNVISTAIIGGSTFENAELSFSFSGIRALPVGVINALLRPFPWEAKKVNQAAAAVENLGVLIFVLYGWWIYLFRLPREGCRSIRGLMWGSLSISIVCAAGVGLFASNLGTISRYRIPLIPFWVTAPGLALGTAALARERAAGIIGRQPRLDRPIMIGKPRKQRSLS